LDDLREWIPWLRKVAQGIDYDAAEDLAQEGMIALWKAQKTHDPARGPLNWWLKFKAHGRMLDVWKASLKVDVPAEDDDLDCAVWIDLDSIQVAYHHGELYEALQTLTERQREYVYMRFWRQATGKELVAHFGYAPGALWTHATSGARKKLREKLQHMAVSA